ncbi:UDP-galactose/UDP-glucose transporter 5 [Ananas comosus]|nr:UDP-galactose/UDP-glucose transporter 5 [Ananas comosus]
MLGYLGFDGFTSTFQDKLFKGYDMEIHNQIFYTTICSCLLSLSGLILQNHLLPAVDFMFRHRDCFFDVALLSTLVSIMLSCVWFAHPFSWEQWIGSAIVFGALYTKSFLRNKPQKPTPSHGLDANTANDRL